jgi:glycosyltransferase involved in cell wall biosynthesis
VVVDGGSTDRTLKKARKYTKKIIRVDNPPIFHINKQKALDACRGTWILQLDADERVSNALRNEIIRVVLKKDNDVNGYFIARKNYFWGHLMKKGGQYPDYVLRLVRNGYAHFPCTSVHEQIEISGKTGYLRHPLEHISYRTKEDYWRKSDVYTTLTAHELKSQHVSKNIFSWVIYMVVKPIRTFISLYIRHKGILDGMRGLEFALWSGRHHQIAYKKYLEL